MARQEPFQESGPYTVVARHQPNRAAIAKADSPLTTSARSANDFHSGVRTLVPTTLVRLQRRQESGRRARVRQVRRGPGKSRPTSGARVSAIESSFQPLTRQGAIERGRPDTCALLGMRIIAVGCASPQSGSRGRMAPRRQVARDSDQQCSGRPRHLQVESSRRREPQATTRSE